jgi:hypothetical protein
MPNPYLLAPVANYITNRGTIELKRYKWRVYVARMENIRTENCG